MFTIENIMLPAFSLLNTACFSLILIKSFVFTQSHIRDNHHPHSFHPSACPLTHSSRALSASTTLAT
jgi:hypothetical protein